MGKKQTIEEEINNFLEFWDIEKLASFLRDIIPLLELYEVDEDNDWVKEAIGEEDEQTIRLIRTAYLMSKIAEFHAAKLCYIKMHFKNLYKRLENESYNRY